ncbi:Hypothetical predicted protein [Paramuricea clavata]|uniref:Uncharacterized protein n=1 Tax=Paramuricea clavata TaxID=317549 RepID=A0A7D9DXX7_PARCT|nr:Hypothetical predicted protein [Paramuricea clavata]
MPQLHKLLNKDAEPYDWETPWAGIENMEKLFVNEKLSASVRIMKLDDEYFFTAKDVAESLGYIDTDQAIRKSVWKKYKFKVEDPVYRRGSQKLHPDTLFIFEQDRPLIGNQIRLLNETELHYKVVEYLRKYYPDAIVIAGLGENQDTSYKRINSARKGYLKDQPDILIVSPCGTHSGFAIELKHRRDGEC